MSFVEQYLLQLNTEKRRWRRAVVILTALSLAVALVTMWNLRMTGITIANSASCGIEEHRHTAECVQDCGKQEHIHDTGCYADTKKDVETASQWQDMFADYPYTGDLRKDLVGIAKTQVGYTESQANFEANEDGIRRGYTRYGAWYGAPYNDWSAMFVSFCLHFAGADETEFPNSSGAATMAERWKKQEKFEPLGQYVPQSGDVVFFNNNTAGIVAEVFNATFYVIRGDAQDAVKTGMLSLADSSIAGWGVTGEKSQKPPDTAVLDVDVLDISNGPSVHIFEGGTAPTPTHTHTYALRSTRAITELLPYLQTKGGDYFFTLLDHNNMELPKDAQGNYIAQANVGYKLTISFTSPKGFQPGTYQYQIPNGLMVDGGEGTFILKDTTNVGNWEVTDTGLITLVFNEHINSRTDITISATMGIHFPEQEDPIDFDGKITVSVEKPPGQSNPTYLNKWGQGGVAGTGKPDTSKIYWSMEIIGNKDSQIPGNILTDRIIFGEWSKTHRFTESDIASGLTFGVSDPYGGWHAWSVHTDDPRLIWTETGWSYKMPTTATCQWCGEITLGNEGWYYYIDYTSTPDRTGTAGTFGYENDATIDGAYGYAWVNFTHGEMTGEINKNGAFVSDAGGGSFLWEFQAIIPGRVDGQKADYHWYVMDSMSLLDGSGQYISRVENDSHLATVYITVNGTTIPVPNVRAATDADVFAWDNAWTAVENGINYGREFNILHRCQCTPDTCFWGNHCDAYWYDRGDGTYTQNGFCQCWTPTEETVFTFVYETKDLSLLEKYGGTDYQLYNEANLYYKPDGSSASLISGSTATIPIPGIFKKELTHDFNGYTANYKITVNEAKIPLTDGSPLTIHDVMSDTLAYINGSLVITTENAIGHTSALQQGVDYTVTYDGTGKQTDSAGKKVHVLDIVILHPQPVMYILNYDTTLIIPAQITGGVKYSNSATITLWGEDFSDNAVEKVYADINIAAKSFAVDMFKTCALTNKPLPGATFGLFNMHGGLIATGVTDVNGKLSFQTNVVAGIILQEHMAYYLQELRPPPAYQLDETKHWFCFCSGTSDACDACNVILLDVDAIRIPYEQVGVVDIVNHLANVELPATGGPGVLLYMLSGLFLIVSPLVYGFSLSRRYGRRSKQ